MKHRSMEYKIWLRWKHPRAPLNTNQIAKAMHLSEPEVHRVITAYLNRGGGRTAKLSVVAGIS